MEKTPLSFETERMKMFNDMKNMKSPCGTLKKAVLKPLKNITVKSSAEKPARPLLNFQHIRNAVSPAAITAENGMLKVNWFSPNTSEREMMKNMKDVM